MAISAAPKAGTPATKTATTKVASKTAAAKTAQVGTKPLPPVKVAQPPKKDPYALPAIDPTLVVRLFENFPEYKQYKIVSLEALIAGMAYIATSPVKGIGPGGLPVTSTPWANFLAQLVQMAVEKGSKGIARNS